MGLYSSRWPARVPGALRAGAQLPNERARVQIKGKWGFVDPRGEMTIQPKYDGANGYNEDLAPVKLGDKWGYIDKQGKTAIAFQFPSAASFNEGLAAVQVGSR